jgi:hypothetical protein
LTGPDHLSALATLSAVSDCFTSFRLGVRWGIGHSTGLLLVGVVLIIRDYSKGGDADVIDMPDALSHFFESIVGIFMLFLGVYGFQRALRKRHELQGRIALSSEVDEDEEVDDVPIELPEKDRLSLSKGISYHDDPLHHHHHNVLDALSHMVADEYPLQPTLELEAENSERSEHSVRAWGDIFSSSRLFNSSRRFSAKTMAVFAGIIHGLAGPGGVLGVIPAVQLHNWKLATLYLGCFCVSSTLTMGCFASFYGLFSSSLGRQTRLEFQIHCFSASLSILVGITWLVLLSMGKLEDVFP